MRYTILVFLSKKLLEINDLIVNRKIDIDNNLLL